MHPISAANYELSLYLAIFAIVFQPPCSCPVPNLLLAAGSSVIDYAHGTKRSAKKLEVFIRKLTQLTHAIRTRHYHILLREYECDADKRDQKKTKGDKGNLLRSSTKIPDSLSFSYGEHGGQIRR